MEGWASCTLLRWNQKPNNSRIIEKNNVNQALRLPTTGATGGGGGVVGAGVGAGVVGAGVGACVVGAGVGA